LLGLLAVLAAASGCASITPPSSQIDPGNAISRLRSGVLVYRVYSTTETKTPDRVQILSIKYPHPDGRAGYALAEAVVGDLSEESETVEPPWVARLATFARDTLPGMAFGEGIKEAKAFDIPVSDLEAVLDRLGEEGYFHQPNSLPSPVELAVEVNGHRQDKPWRRVVELDRLYSDVRAKGSLVAFRQSASSLTSRHAVRGGPHVDTRQPASGRLAQAPIAWSAQVTPYAQPQVKRLPPLTDQVLR
jgi:hypothetical protein